MADAEEKAKAEKLAAAKKRVEEMKKKKQKRIAVKKEEKAEPAESSKTEEPSDPAADPPPEPEYTKEEEPKEAEEPETNDADEKTPLVSPVSHGRQPSLSLESKMRSASFRAGSGGPLSPNYGFSPEGDTAPDIYRKQALRIEELEKDNKRLAKEASDGERRWKKAEEELEEMREAEDEVAPKRDISTSPGSSEEVGKLRTEIAALQRQNTQLLAQSSRPRHGSSPSMSQGVPADYEAILASKSSTIESMEIEISTLRGRLDQIAAGSSEKEQVTALEEKLKRSEKAAAVAQRELSDLKKNLERTTQKAVKEGSDRISAETKLRNLEREAEEAKAHSEELQKKVDALEKKVTTLATLHKEHDARFQSQKKSHEKAEKEAINLRTKLTHLETENSQLKEAQERARKHAALGQDDDGVDELENEERQRLEKKVRDLEAEVHELRRGVWRDRRQQLEGDDSSGLTSPGARFTDVDLGGGMSPNRRRSVAAGGGKSGFGEFISSGFNAITGVNALPLAADDLLEDDEDMEFDEEAFRVAQEEEAKKRIERVKEVKRALKNWEGYRLDLVENRKGGGEGVGEIFEV